MRLLHVFQGEWLAAASRVLQTELWDCHQGPAQTARPRWTHTPGLPAVSAQPAGNREEVHQGVQQSGGPHRMRPLKPEAQAGA